MTASRVGLEKSCGSTTALYLQHAGGHCDARQRTHPRKCGCVFDT